MTDSSAPDAAPERIGADQIGEQIGVVLMAYGTPRSAAEIEPYYTDIRRGRPRPPNCSPS